MNNSNQKRWLPVILVCVSLALSIVLMTFLAVPHLFIGVLNGTNDREAFIDIPTAIIPQSAWIATIALVSWWIVRNKREVQTHG